jgi:hypothetical protein
MNEADRIALSGNWREHALDVFDPASIRRILTNVRMMATFTSAARSPLRTLESIASQIATSKDF